MRLLEARNFVPVPEVRDRDGIELSGGGAGTGEAAAGIER